MLRKINYIFSLKQKVILFLMILISIGAGLLETLGVSLVLPLISIIMDEDIVYENASYTMIMKRIGIDNSRDFIFAIAIILILVFIFKNLYLMWACSVQLDFTINCKKDISTRLMRCYVEQKYLYHVEHSVSELQRNLLSDVTSFFNMIQSCMLFLTESITVIFIVIYLMWIDSITLVILSAIIGIFMFLVLQIYKRYQVKAGELSRLAGKSLNKWIIQTFGGIKEIKALSREDYFCEHYEEAYEMTNRAIRMSTLLTRYPKYVLESICITGLLVVVCIRIRMGVNLFSFATSLSAFAVAAMRLLPSFNRITDYLGNILKSKPSTDNVYNDLVEKAQLEENSLINKESDKASIELNRSIEIRDLSFRYPQNNECIFDGANVTIAKNESIAFIGSSGAGKTTLADILLGLIEPNGGEILVDGIDVFSHLPFWHKTIGYVPQNIFLMDDTIKNNITFGTTDVNERKIWKAMELAQISDYVRNLPDGIDTIVGDRGVRLSGGQRQRIGIARALYQNPQLLVLDEATSALDNDTEKAVMEAIENLHGKMTLIIIAHRLSTIEKCDKIYEIIDGKILERHIEEIFPERHIHH